MSKARKLSKAKQKRKDEFEKLTESLMKSELLFLKNKHKSVY